MVSSPKETSQGPSSKLEEPRKDPKVRQYINELATEIFQNHLKSQGNNGWTDGNVNQNRNTSNLRTVKTPVNNNRLDDIQNNRSQVKSPPDTTLYTPALKKATKENNATQEISNFVDSIRLWDQKDGLALTRNRREAEPGKRTYHQGTRCY